MTTYGIANQDGHPLTDGLDEHEARRIAQNMANERGESVELCQHGIDQPWPDGEWFTPLLDAIPEEWVTETNRKVREHNAGLAV